VRLDERIAHLRRVPTVHANVVAAGDPSLSQNTTVLHVALCPLGYWGSRSVGVPVENQRPINHAVNAC
jgi:hypothetical protein